MAFPARNVQSSVPERDRERLKADKPIYGSVTSIQGKTFRARVADVSRRGLGVLVQHSLAPGSTITWERHDRAMALEVVYCQSHMGIDNLFRCGLFSRHPDADMRDFFPEIERSDEVTKLHNITNF